MTFLQRFTEATKGIEHLATGIASCCDTCCGEWNMKASELDDALEAGTVVDESFFSWSKCDTCNAVAGDRSVAHGTIDGKLQHFHVCDDCLCYLANGDLPTEPSGV